MKINEQFPVSFSKKQTLQKKIDSLGIDLGKVEEIFTRGGGKGGQKVNKSSNAVILSYPPLKLQVRVHRERERSLNRFLALRELVEQAEMILSPQTSERLKSWERIKKQKKRRARRSIQEGT